MVLTRNISPIFIVSLIALVAVNDRPYGAIPGSAYWRHPMIGLMEPPDDRPNGATSGSA